MVNGTLSPDEYRLVAKDGTTVWIISNSQPVIIDGNFKGIIGVFTNITEKKKKPSTPCILASGHPREDVMTHETVAHADGFLQKPFSLHELGKTVNEVMGKKR